MTVAIIERALALGAAPSRIPPKTISRSSRRTCSATIRAGYARVPAHALYIDPPLGRAGMTEVEVHQSRRRVLVGQRPMTRVARAVEKGETRGFRKVLVDRDTEGILGASILGPGGDEVIHCVLDLTLAKAPYTVLQRTMHIYPTVLDLLPTILDALQPL